MKPQDTAITQNAEDLAEEEGAILHLVARDSKRYYVLEIARMLRLAQTRARRFVGRLRERDWAELWYGRAHKATYQLSMGGRELAVRLRIV